MKTTSSPAACGSASPLAAGAPAATTPMTSCCRRVTSRCDAAPMPHNVDAVSAAAVAAAVGADSIDAETLWPLRNNAAAAPPAAAAAAAAASRSEQPLRHRA